MSGSPVRSPRFAHRIFASRSRRSTQAIAFGPSPSSASILASNAEHRSTSSWQLDHCNKPQREYSALMASHYPYIGIRPRPSQRPPPDRALSSRPEPVPVNHFAFLFQSLTPRSAVVLLANPLERVQL